MLLQNKIALITGGSRGIGEAIVRKFAAEGATVAFSYVSENSAERAEKLVEELTANGATVLDRSKLPATLLKGGTAALAVSVEPPGGSPTGVPVPCASM